VLRHSTGHELYMVITAAASARADTSRKRVHEVDVSPQSRAFAQ
jgi:hypothetical protein